MSASLPGCSVLNRVDHGAGRANRERHSITADHQTLLTTPLPPDLASSHGQPSSTSRRPLTPAPRSSFFWSIMHSSTTVSHEYQLTTRTSVPVHFTSKDFQCVVWTEKKVSLFREIFFPILIFEKQKKSININSVQPCSVPSARGRSVEKERERSVGRCQPCSHLLCWT